MTDNEPDTKSFTEESNVAWCRVLFAPVPPTDAPFPKTLGDVIMLVPPYAAKPPWQG